MSSCSTQTVYSYIFSVPIKLKTVGNHRVKVCNSRWPCSHMAGSADVLMKVTRTRLKPEIWVLSKYIQISALMCPTPPPQYPLWGDMGRSSYSRLLQVHERQVNEYTCIFIILCTHYVNTVTELLTQSWSSLTASASRSEAQSDLCGTCKRSHIWTRRTPTHTNTPRWNLAANVCSHFAIGTTDMVVFIMLITDLWVLP